MLYASQSVDWIDRSLTNSYIYIILNFGIYLIWSSTLLFKRDWYSPETSFLWGCFIVSAFLMGIGVLLGGLVWLSKLIWERDAVIYNPF